MTIRTGPRNLITDVPGVLIGNAHDGEIATGVTVVLPDTEIVQKFTGAIDVRGGGPATRDTNPLELTSTVDECHALVLSGGSAFGLGAADAVQAHLRDRGIGLQLAGQTIPIVPQAILFDLANGGNKNWGQQSPYPALAAQAIGAADSTFELGSHGAGYGATTADARGGLGSASTRDGDITVGALAAVNALGSTIVPGSKYFWGAAYEIDGEFGGHGLPASIDPLQLSPTKGSTPSNTTLCVVATNASLTKAQCHRLAVMAQAGLTQAIRPAHTPYDGDLVFALSTGLGPIIKDPADLTRFGQIASRTLARAIARAIYEAATPPRHLIMPPAYRDTHPA